MRLIPFAVYLAGVILAAALLAYPLWAILGAVGVDGLPFHKLTFRLLEACALLGLWPLMSWLGLNSAGGFGLGRGHPGGAWRPAPAGGLAAGFAAGVAVLGLIVLGLLLFDVRAARIDIGAGDIGVILAKALVTGLVVALIEEIWFRGALQRGLEQRAGTAFAIAATAALYAAVHFIRPDLAVPAGEVGFGSGIVVIAGAFGRFSDPQILDSLLALAAAGVLLSLVRRRTGRIWECIGLHAGFVATIRVSRELTTLDVGSPYRYLVGSFDGIVGLLACAVFAALALSYWRFGVLRAPAAK